MELNQNQMGYFIVNVALLKDRVYGLIQVKEDNPALMPAVP
jgi:hypothetical protein